MIIGAGFAMIGGAAKELIWDKLFGKGTAEFADAYATMWTSMLTAILIYAGYNVYLNYII